MNRKKAILYIDGSNFYHGIKSNGMKNRFQYSDFYKQLSVQYDIVEVNYYDALKNISIEPVQYAKQQTFHSAISKDIPNLKLRTRKLKYNFHDTRVSNAKSLAVFCRNCSTKIDNFLMNAGLKKLSREKGIDVLLTTDLIKGAFQNRYDVALLASGDADCVPAVELAQSLKKEVINVHFYEGSAHELRQVCNSHLLIQLDANGQCYFR